MDSTETFFEISQIFLDMFSGFKTVMFWKYQWHDWLFFVLPLFIVLAFGENLFANILLSRLVCMKVISHLRGFIQTKFLIES